MTTADTQGLAGGNQIIYKAIYECILPALDNEDCELGVRCVAVPIRDYTGRITAGLSVSGPVSRLTDEVILARMDRLKRIASEASRALGFSG